MNFQELELKYYVKDLSRLQTQVQALGSVCDQERVLEINLRFDRPDYLLSKNGQALRLRYDTHARLTFKGPSQAQEGIRLRQEIEFVASDYQAARAFLLALGFQVVLIYEKYRTGYKLGDVHILLDELPYGNFVEIEGPDPAQILEVNNRLGLNFERRVEESYTVLFERLRDQLHLPTRDLVFESFAQIPITADDLGVQPADE
ncbi:MAG: class IV adenylate cyclase [Anaerolineales bacterium]|nr:class IV adenylate cyclase [Anaerolineales bacterium]